MLNKVMLIGRLGKDPEVRYTQTNTAVANFTIATTERWKDKEGQQQEKTEWHRIVAWGRLGEICGQYLQKGKQIYVEGNLQTREWTDNNNQKRYTTEVRIAQMQMLGAAGDSTAAPARAANDLPSDVTSGGGDLPSDVTTDADLAPDVGEPDEDDELPF